MPTRANNEWTEAELAYFAGILDGEGTIQVAMHRKTVRPTYFRAEVYVTNTSKKLLRWIQQRFGGKIGRAKKLTNANWKPVYRISVPAADIELVLRQILPYLVVKKRLAEIAVELRSRLRFYSHPLSEEERALRYALYTEAKMLNQRGVVGAERLSEETPSPKGKGGATVRSHGKLNHESCPEMDNRLPN